MLFHGTLEFKGAAPFRWVQRQGDGEVHLVFDHRGAESVLEFSADAWAAIWKAAALLETGAGQKNEDRTTVSNPLKDEDGKGVLKVSGLVVSADDQPIQFLVEVHEMDLADDRFPAIIMKTPGDSFGIELFLNPKAAKELRDRLDKVLEAHAAVKVLAKPKTVPAFAR